MLFIVCYLCCICLFCMCFLCMFFSIYLFTFFLGGAGHGGLCLSPGPYQGPLRPE